MTVDLNTLHLPVIVISVGNKGVGYDLWTNVEQQYLQMKANGREHGLGRICRLSDQVLPSVSSPFFRVSCTLYDIPWPGSLCDEYAWCERVILDYSVPPSVWFGSRRYPLWWHYTEGGGKVWLKQWAILSALDFALDHQIQQITFRCDKFPLSLS